MTSLHCFNYVTKQISVPLLAALIDKLGGKISIAGLYQVFGDMGTLNIFSKSALIMTLRIEESNRLYYTTRIFNHEDSRKLHVCHFLIKTSDRRKGQSMGDKLELRTDTPEARVRCLWKNTFEVFRTLHKRF